MKNYLFFLRALPGKSDEFTDWLLKDLGPRIAATDACASLRVNVAVDSPNTDPLYRQERREGDGFDASLDLACPDEPAFEGLQRGLLADLNDRTEANYGYDVAYLLEKEDPDALRGNPAPGYKIMRGFYFFDDLSPEAARRCWDNHVALALKIHGFDKYVRYWVNKIVTKDAPAIGGATNLQFSSADKFLNNYFTVPDGMEQIQQDIGHFIDRGLARIYTREHILK
ncbi:hypothetical protein CSC94_11760 [Zhengella mangrovi]|uniref:EthD domain-containing protein n=1 Tax=Zhengella mangrovi TaxID=1982044 RepID=A0A2G1QML3_9HYPH|nr:EthD domain-containing protein [Zhengella mangrovi]PHP66777.1 hypothetical protein CSC94_11760 [Zhengella mangrovi]